MRLTNEICESFLRGSGWLENHDRSLSSGYISPIQMNIADITDKIGQSFNQELDDQILKEVHRVGIYVDKKELQKAMEYDRGQYEKGFKDGYEKGIDRLICLLIELFDLEPRAIATLKQVAKETKGDETE